VQILQAACRALLITVLGSGAIATAATQPLKVFISVDMEGITGVYSEKEVSRGQPDYEYFREIMTRDTNAAIEGAFAAGATDVLVREGHGGMNHLLIDMLDKRVRIVRGPTHPQSMMVMMEGFDSSFGAVVLVGYHARTNYPNSILPHTMGKEVLYFKVNGQPQSEAGYNALIAGLYDVPVVMLSGDKAACEEARQTIAANMEIVAVKEALNGGVITLHPQAARKLIREATERGVRNRANIRPYKLAAPYAITMKVAEPRRLMEGASLNAAGEIEFTSPDLFKALNAMVQMW
jgi:D-amino peptidase